MADAVQVADEIGRDQSAVAFAVCRPAPTRVVAIAADAVGGKEWVGPKNKETRIAGGRRSGSRRMRVGGTRTSHTLTGQRITVAPATSATAQADTKVFAGAVQLVT